MPRTAGLWRTIVHRARADLPVVVAAGILLLCATTLITAGVLYGDTVALGGLRRAVENAAPADRAVVVRASVTTTDLATIDPLVTTQIEDAVGSTDTELARVERSGTFADPTVPVDQVHDLTVFAAFEHIEDHATLASGHWPDAGHDPLEAALSDGAARSMGLAIGDRISLVSRLEPRRTVDVAIVGIWQPSPDDPYWLGDPLELDGIAPGSAFTTRGPLVVAAADLQGRIAGQSLDVQWRAIPSVDGLRVADVGALRGRLEALGSALGTVLPRSIDASATRGLAGVLAAVDRSLLVTRSLVVILTLQFAVLAGYAVVLTGGLLVDHRRTETALLRSRGATTGHLTVLTLGEALLLAVPAALLAPPLAVGLVALLGMVGPLSGSGVVDTIDLTPASLLVAGLSALAGVVVLTLPTLVAGGDPATVRAVAARPSGRTLAQRLGLDIALLVLAAIGLWQLRLYGAPLVADARGALGLDPLLVVAPAAGLLAGAVLATRIVPRVAELGELALARRSGLVAPLGARQVARRPLRYTRSALLLMLAAAVGTFAVIDAATWSRSETDQATYQTAADVRVVERAGPQPPSWALQRAYLGVAGVEAALPVVHGTVDVGQAVQGATVLELDARSAPSVVALPVGSTGATDGLRALADARPTTAAILLPAGSRRIAVTLDAALVATDPFSGAIITDQQAAGDVVIGVVVEGADGRLQRVDGPAVQFSGKGQVATIPLAARVGDAPVVPAGPLRLEAIELTVRPSPGVGVDGRLDLRAMAVSPDAAGATWTPLAFDPAAAGWVRLVDDSIQGVAPYTAPRGVPAESIGVQVEQGRFEQFDTVYRLLAAPARSIELPVLAGDAFLRATGASVGDVLAAQRIDGGYRLRIVGSTERFPPLDPATPFLVVDGPTADLARFLISGYTVSTDEWWLRTTPGRSADVGRAVAAAPFPAASVTVRSELAATFGADPIRLGVVGALALGALAALAFATVGFLVGGTVSTAERIGEFALLRSLGLSHRQLAGWLSLEHVFLLVVGLVSGTAIGLLLAWIVLPSATLDASGAPVVPPPVLVVPWPSAVALAALALALLLAMTAVVARQLPDAEVSGVLRARDE